MKQFRYLFKDINSLLGRNKYRVIVLLFNRAFWGVLSYRLDRFFYGMFKSYYKFIRILFSPFFYLLQIISNCDIHHKAEIQGGINIHHPSAGIVISGKAKIGEMLTLTGGNIIGVKNGSKGIIIGNNCNIGANACIIGPLQLGNNIKIAAMACVVKSFYDDNLSLIGVPAKIN
ncbi:serine O-acetyltransferase [Psychroflexus gondwanensis ACAM 44]|uniref:Serine acetyltransferase n=1 Tax=Psychroflexus gondwanensis ACAM 44 TaxID=1189619 RepID=N1WUE5_9FLAO|nr:serine O-acetyltransferase [Psychroflexus gondwanensis ACAM 44]